MADNTVANPGSGGSTFVSALSTFSGAAASLPGSFLGIITGSEGAWTINVVVGGAGAVTAGTQRVTLASDDPAATSLAILDDWDESDRAKVNPIVGQAGVAAGSGAAGATTQRVVLATDDPGVALLTTIDTDTSTLSAAVQTDDAAYASGDTGFAMFAVRDDALTTLTPIDGDYVPLRVNSTGALHVTGGGGGTEYSVDDALGLTPTGSVLLATRDDALSALTPVEGDAVALRTDANGALWVTQSGTVASTQSGTWTVDLGVTDNAVLDQLATNTTNLQNCIIQDGQPFTPATGYLMMIGGELDDTATAGVTEGQAGNVRITANRSFHTVIRDNAGNERGLNIDASGQISVTDISGTVSLPTGASTAAKQPALGTAGTASTDVITVQGIASMTALTVDGSAVTQPVSGTVTANLGVTDNAVLDSIVTNTTYGATTGGGVESGAVRVTIANDSTGLVSIDDNGGSITVDIPAVATGGATPGKLVSAATTNATSVKASAGTLYTLAAFNVNAAARYLKLYNKASAPTVGTDTPVMTLAIPGNTAGAGFTLPIPSCGIEFSTGIAFALTTEITDAGTTAVALNEIVVNYSYK